MKFNLAEKLAIVKAIDEVILADGNIDEGEMVYLSQLMVVLEFDVNFVQEARQLNVAKAILIMRGMTDVKKHSLAIMLNEMAKADGQVDKNEMEVIISIFLAAGIDISNPQEKESKFNVSDIYFESSDHIRYEHGKHVSGPHGGARRAIKVEPNIEGGKGYTTTIYNLDGNHPVWGNNIQMAPKQMEIIDATIDKTILRGYGEDPRAMGHPNGSFSNYGISIHHPNNQIEKIVLHMHDKNVDVEYLK